MEANDPIVFLGRGADLAAIRRLVLEGDANLRPAVKRLEEQAAEAMVKGTWSVTDKKVRAPSGDPHDFVGMAAYWWPNPDTEDGLPYVPRDGVINPEQGDYDGPALRAMVEAVTTLASHAFFCSSAESGAQTVKVLDRWFVSPETRMNPHLEFGGYTPGVWDGTGWGIVGTHGLVSMLESVALLRAVGLLPKETDAGLMTWIEAYLNWLLTSDHGKFEADRPNNHSTSYDSQVMTMALHLGQEAIARKVAEEIPYRRIGIQLEHNGQQPWEVARTKSWGYSSGNLLFLMHLADLAVHVGVDVWNYQTGDGRCLRRSFDYMLPAALGRQEWPWEVIGGWTGAGERWVEILRRASLGFGDPALDALAPELDAMTADAVAADRVQLICPRG